MTAPDVTLIVDDMPQSLEWLAQAALSAYPRTTLLQAATLAEARALIAGRPPPGLALVDLDLPDGSGVTLIEQLARMKPRPVIVVATVFADDRHVFPALRAGAVGYVLKDASIEHLAALLAHLPHGGAALSGPIANRIVDWFHDPDAASGPALSPREQDLLQLLAKGLTIAQSAAALGITPGTAASYAKVLYRKLDVTSRAEATLEAARRGLIKP
jgi:DNA-binding NarL/FixJ family response regulator